MSSDPSVPTQGQGEPLAAYFRDHRSDVLRRLATDGSLLFRGFGPLTVESFRQALAELVEEFLEAQGEHIPVGAESHVFNPVRYSPRRKLLWHNENSFNSRWPHVIAFGCVRPADRGGESLLADSRAMLAALDPSIVEEFRAKGVQYVRRMGLGIDRHWKEIFGTASKAEVEARCVAQDCSFRWLSADVLETVGVRSATVFHPVTGDECWFNQLQHWHWQCLDPDVRNNLIATLGKNMMPRDCRFGDGSTIPDDVVQHILDRYKSLEVEVACTVGDVLIVDNLAMAHGRNPYEGRRELLVAMGSLRSPG